MPAEDRFIERLDPATRQRIREDYDRFAPFLALLGAWQEEIQSHVQQLEQNSVARLQKEIFPEGNWKFPNQILAVPEDLKSREISDTVTFMSGSTPWTPCGNGWTLPSRLESWNIEEVGDGKYLFACEIHFEGRYSNVPLLTSPQPPNDSGQSQLAFVPAPEHIIAQLVKAPWAIQYPGQPCRPISVRRYQGYLGFENSLRAAREKQRQLEVWLPAFFPYSRKFVQFLIPTADCPSVAFDWSQVNPTPSAKICLVALVPKEVANHFNQQKEPPLILNAYPLAQMRVATEPIRENLDRVGDYFRISFMGVTNGFAASIRETYAINGANGTNGIDGEVRSRYHAPRMIAKASDIGRSQSGSQNIDILCERPQQMQNDYQVRLYFDCYGEKAEMPTRLVRQSNQQCTIPYLPLGSMDAPMAEYGAMGARRAWYQMLLRPPQLTTGDLLEILSQIPDCARFLKLDADSVVIQLDIDNEPQLENSSWDSYLWPGRMSDGGLLEQRTTALGHARTAVIPLMRLIFSMNEVKSAGNMGWPAFLEDDLMRYVASVISQYFMVGWYRVVAQKARGDEQRSRP